MHKMRNHEPKMFFRMSKAWVRTGEGEKRTQHFVSNLDCVCWSIYSYLQI